MTVTYLLAPEPIWALINNEGTLAGGSKLFTYRSLNKIQTKLVYQDPGGTIPWTNPIIFDANGTQGPFYWSVDSAALNDTYYLEAYDSDDNLLWTLDNFAPPGSGGGSDVTTYINLTNYITNNTFIDSIADTANPTNTTNLVIAPSNHKGFTPALINPVVGTNGVLGPDIRFVKNNTNATDQITFPLFIFGNDPLTGDTTPNNYVRYQCTNSPAGETFKAFQFPICQKVKNLNNQDVTFSVWAAVTATPVTLTVFTRQYFGSGTAASAEVLTTVGTITLTTTWTDYSVPFTVPSVAGKSLGTPGLQTNDDALYVWLGMPLGQACDVLWTKPALYLGTVNPSSTFTNYDQIDSINQTPRTGDIRVSLTSSAPNGWLAMNDGSIGSASSGATSRANMDTFQLFKTLWDGVSDTYAPVSTGRGASAVADFVANKNLTLTRSLGRALAAAGAGSGLTSRALGEFGGADTHTIAAGELPAHTHTLVGQNIINNGVSAGFYTAGASGALATTTGVNSTANTPMSILQPTSFMNVFIKL